MDTYLTISGQSEGLYKDKGSKFIALAYPVSSESDIKEILAEVKKKYYDARHHCYAWQISDEETLHRINDDGEPSGTAGKPIYGQILSQGLTNVLIIVVRYFGGIKLGVRGLINAYKGAALMALQQADIVEKIRESSYRVNFAYSAMNDVMKIVKDHDLATLDHVYDLHCQFVFSVRKNMESSVIDMFAKIQDVQLSKIS